MGATTPICSNVGRSPIRKVAPPIRRRVVTSMDLRPIRSPRWPKTAPPMGRAKKPTPNVAKDARVPASGSNRGKNSFGNTSAAASHMKEVIPLNGRADKARESDSPDGFPMPQFARGRMPYRSLAHPRNASRDRTRACSSRAAGAKPCQYNAPTNAIPNVGPLTRTHATRGAVRQQVVAGRPALGIPLYVDFYRARDSLLRLL